MNGSVVSDQIVAARAYEELGGLSRVAEFAGRGYKGDGGWQE